MGEEGAGRCARLFPNSYTALAEAADATKAVVKDVLNEQSMLEVKDESDEDTSREEPHASDMLQAAFDARVREHPSNTCTYARNNQNYTCKQIGIIWLCIRPSRHRGAAHWIRFHSGSSSSLRW